MTAALAIILGLVLLGLLYGPLTTLYVKGEKNNGVVNVPSDGTERPVKSIFYITQDEN
mgnify:CR=1 FL=1